MSRKDKDVKLWREPPGELHREPPGGLQREKVGKLSRKIPLTCYVDNNDFTALEDLSRRTGESVSALVRKAIKKFLEVAT